MAKLALVFSVGNGANAILIYQKGENKPYVIYKPALKMSQQNEMPVSDICREHYSLHSTYSVDTFHDKS